MRKLIGFIGAYAQNHAFILKVFESRDNAVERFGVGPLILFVPRHVFAFQTLEIRIVIEIAKGTMNKSVGPIANQGMALTLRIRIRKAARRQSVVYRSSNIRDGI